MGSQWFDQYSLLHTATGILAYFWNMSFVTALVVHTLFEWLENTQKGMAFIRNFTYWPGGKEKADSLRNSIGDTIAFAIGWGMSYGLDHYGNQRGWYKSHL